MTKDLGILKSQLASLLSFDLEDIGDIFEPLLDFDSEEDLSEYMCALLGEQSDEINIFVSNMLRYQKGLGIIHSVCDNAVTVSSAVAKVPSLPPQRSDPAIKKREENDRREELRLINKRKEIEEEERRKSSEQKRRTAELENERKTTEEEEKQKILKEQRQAEEKALLDYKRAYEEKQKHLKLASSLEKCAISEKKKKTGEVAKIKRPCGQAKIVCGCFGTIHKPLANCLHCGRISCEKEGYGYCPHCTNLIEKVSFASNRKEFEQANLHKERLLKFDQENTKRTMIYDDQADYFQNSSSTWLTEDEQNDAKTKEERRRTNLHTIKKHTLSIRF